MSATDRYLAELRGALRVRGTARRRILRECRDHLADAAHEVGEEAAVVAFGAPAELAAAFDAEVAARRGAGAARVTTAAVVATGGSTLALIHAADPGAPAGPLLPRVAFFVAAQVAAVALLLAVAQALADRRAPADAGRLVLLARRSDCALVAAGATLLAAGDAVPGQGSATALLAGPALLAVAALAVRRARRLAQSLPGSGPVAPASPLDDLATLGGLPLPPVPAVRLLPAVTALAAAAAFAWDRGEQATVTGALTAATVEAVAVVASFVVLGPRLGLRTARHHCRRRAAAG